MFGLKQEDFDNLQKLAEKPEEKQNDLIDFVMRNEGKTFKVDGNKITVVEPEKQGKDV